VAGGKQETWRTRIAYQSAVSYARNKTRVDRGWERCRVRAVTAAARGALKISDSICAARGGKCHETTGHDARIIAAAGGMLAKRRHIGPARIGCSSPRAVSHAQPDSYTNADANTDAYTDTDTHPDPDPDPDELYQVLRGLRIPVGVQRAGAKRV